MNISDLDKDTLVNKYQDILKFSCYVDDEELCYNFSENINGICNSCKEKNNNKIYLHDSKKNFNKLENNIVIKLKDLINKCETLDGKTENETNKEYRTKICLELFKIVYHNPFFSIKNPKFLIVTTNKIIDIVKIEYKFLKKYIENNIQYKDIFYFMIKIKDFITNYMKTNNLEYDKNMNIDVFNKFLDEYVNLLDKYYSNIINSKKNKDNDEILNNIIDDIDINQIENMLITLEI